MGKIEKIQPSGIFTNYIFKSIPLAFDESLSYYEMLCGILDLLKTQEEVINNNADLLAELEEYVKHYFDNLDVQEEINNKLDEMAQDGTLEEIIIEYLQIKGILGFNRKNELKQATNLIDGSIAKTLGEDVSTDGLGHFYKIRQIVNTDVIDDDNILALTNYPNLVAVKIPESLIGNLTELTTTNKTNLVNAINEVASNLQLANSIKNKNVIIIGDSLDLTDKWGDYFISYSQCNGENYGNGSAGFTSQGITPPYENMTFIDMLDTIILNKTTEEKNNIDYIIVGGGINDALNNHTPADIRTAVNTFISKAKTNFPNAKLIIIPIHTFKWLVDSEYRRYLAILNTCRDNGIMTSPALLFWTVSKRTLDSGDHVHLTDAGYQNLAYRILSIINGSTFIDREVIQYTLATGWDVSTSGTTWLTITRNDNVVYISGVLHYTGGTMSSMTKILDFDDLSYITGGAGFNKYIPCIFYSGGVESMSSLNITNGELKTGRPINYNTMSSPYIYVNGSFTIGLE